MITARIPWVLVWPCAVLVQGDRSGGHTAGNCAGAPGCVRLEVPCVRQHGGEAVRR